MLATCAVLALIGWAAPQAQEVGKGPATPEELAAIAERGRNLAGYDAAAWHASDALQATGAKPGSVARYIARKAEKGWIVAFGKLDPARAKFLVSYEATEADRPDRFKVEEIQPPREDAGFNAAAARAAEVALEDFVANFRREQRPYNLAVLPADEGRFWVYLVPAPTRPGVWPLGGDVRYLVSADGSKVVAKRQLHKAIIENEPPRDQGQKATAGYHTHVLADRPEDTDVFHVLTRKPAVPELIAGKEFVYVVEPHGAPRYLGKADEVFKKR